MNSGIYTITSPSGRQYVGSAINFKDRWALHLHYLRKGKHHCDPLQKAYAKYGEACLTFKILLVCLKKDLLAYEQRAIDILAPAYNVCRIAGSSLGIKRSKETLERMAAAGRACSPEVRARLAEIQRGKKHSPEVLAKMSQAHKGRVFTEERCANISKALKGRTLSAEHVEKIRILNSLKRWSETRREMHSEAIRGEGNPIARPVVCVETGQRFVTTTAAAEWLRGNGFPNASQANISRACIHQHRSAHGYHWQYGLVPRVEVLVQEYEKEAA